MMKKGKVLIATEFGTSDYMPWDWDEEEGEKDPRKITQNKSLLILTRTRKVLVKASLLLEGYSKPPMNKFQWCVDSIDILSER